MQRKSRDIGNTRRMWQGVQVLMDCKSRQGVNEDASLPDRLSNFFSCFEALNLTTRVRAGAFAPSIGPALTINTAVTCRTLTRVNPGKAGGPDNRCVLRTCTGELEDVWTDIFNISLSQAIIPRCFKTSTIIPLAKKSVVCCLNNYRPVSLTPIVFQCIEWLVKPSEGNNGVQINGITNSIIFSILTMLLPLHLNVARYKL